MIMYEDYMRQITNDRINEARKIAAAHRQAKIAGATGPNRATQIISKATGWLATAVQLKVQRPVTDSGAY
jgi:hypothetical protein